LGPPPSVAGMASEAQTTKQKTVRREALIHEIERYLAAVEAFRREGFEPRWRAEHDGGGR
jgi:hypothetical protein